MTLKGLNGCLHRVGGASNGEQWRTGDIKCGRSNEDGEEVGSPYRSITIAKVKFIIVHNL